MDELKPCPMCNGTAELDTMQHFRSIFDGEVLSQVAIFCTKCGVTICNYPGDLGCSREETTEITIAAWNARPTPVGDAANMTILLPPAAVESQEYLEGWCAGQAYLIMNHGNDKAVDGAIEAANLIAAQAAELQRLREGMTRAEAAFTLIAGSHWERFGIDQTDVEQVPDLSSDEAMNVARDFLAYDDFPATSQVRHD